MRINIVFAAMLTSFQICSVNAYEFDHFSYVKKYTKCEAVQNVAANISSSSEQEFFQHELHFSSLDSRVIALEFARAGNHQEEEVENLYATYLAEYKEALNKSEDVKIFLDSLQPEVRKCKQLNEMQKDILQNKKK